MRVNCSVSGIQRHLDDETPAFYAALRESVHQRKNNSVSVSIFTNSCGHPRAACTHYQYWFIQNADNLREAASHLG